MESILQAFSDIASVLPRIDRLKATFRDSADLNHIMGFVYSDILDFHQRAYKIFRRKGWHFWFTVNWGLFERRFKSIIQRLNSHCEILDKEAASIHFLEMKIFREKRQLEDDADEQHRQSEMARSVVLWLSASDGEQEDHLHKLSDDRVPGTCNWVLDDSQMCSWLEDEHAGSVLWMTGIPGAGKSFLCSLIVQNLQLQQELTSLYYFCGKRSSGQDTCAIVLRTLAIQLLRQNQDMVALVYQSFVQKMSSCSSVAMKKILREILPSVKTARVVIDGIDEFNHQTQQEVLKAMVELQKRVGPSCKLLICSRFEPQISRLLSPMIHIKLEHKTHVGLNLYIQRKVKDLESHFWDMERSLLIAVEERLKSKAKEMFLWVRLVVAMLLQESSEYEVEQAIDRLPDGLDEAYGQILSRLSSLSSGERDRAFKILFWVCVAYRPVSIHEVADGIVLHPQQTILSRKTRSRQVDRDIVDLCAPLLEKSDSGALGLVHFSAKEYLVNQQSGPFINKAEAHLFIAVSCMINLTTCLDLIPGFRDGFSGMEEEIAVVQGRYGLQAYGSQFWAEHIMAFLADNRNHDSKLEQLMGVLKGFSQAYKRCIESNVCLHRESINDGELQLIGEFKQIPVYYNFILCWLALKYRLHEARFDFASIDPLQGWKLRNDETYLSLVEIRLYGITERLLNMKSNHLPTYIDESDYHYFLNRSILICRHSDCNYSCSSVQDRNIHEASHTLSFPCLQCDFVQHGFRSRKDLEKHTQKYHMCPEDFVVPDNLHSADDDRKFSRTLIANQGLSFRRNHCWNERGRGVIQQGFRQILAKVEDEMTSTTGSEQESLNSSKHHSSRPTTSVETHSDIKSHDLRNISSIRDRIEAQQYESFADFKGDLHALVGAGEMSPMRLDGRTMEVICDQEIEKPISRHPDFASGGHSSEERLALRIRSDQAQDQFQANSGILGTVNMMNSTFYGSDASSGRQPRWSHLEELEFPELLQQYGRNYTKIADFFKTKTVVDIEQQFADLVKSGRTELVEKADRADSRLQSGTPNTPPITAYRAGSSIPEVDDEEANKGLAHRLPILAEVTPILNLPESNKIVLSTNPSLPETEAIRQVHVQAGSTKAADNFQHPQNKRKPRPRALCSQCKRDFYDEYTRDKHIDREHKPTRKMWVCHDISIDGRFLSKCKSCSQEKKYSTRHYASKHLRKQHFSEETSVETLNGWTKEVEERNPKHRSGLSRSMTEDEPAAKRQRTAIDAGIKDHTSMNPSDRELQSVMDASIRLTGTGTPPYRNGELQTARGLGGEDEHFLGDSLPTGLLDGQNSLAFQTLFSLSDH